MVDKTFILKKNSVEIRKKISEAGIRLCFCAEFVDADWLDYSTAVANGVHGVGYPFEGMSKEATIALYLHELDNPIWCSNVDEFIRFIREFEESNK